MEGGEEGEQAGLLTVYRWIRPEPWCWRHLPSWQWQTWHPGSGWQTLNSNCFFWRVDWQHLLGLQVWGTKTRTFFTHGFATTASNDDDDHHPSLVHTGLISPFYRGGSSLTALLTALLSVLLEAFRWEGWVSGEESTYAPVLWMRSIWTGSHT